MLYRNIVTGIVVDFKSPVSGKNWEPAEAPKAPAKEPAGKETGKAAKSGGRRKKQLCDSE